jgi:hypothetical protein
MRGGTLVSTARVALEKGTVTNEVQMIHGVETVLSNDWILKPVRWTIPEFGLCHE